jgi:hypothetical protein
MSNTGGPAFPCERQLTDQDVLVFEGLSIRDYFAAKAMQSILQAKDVHDSREWKNTAWIAYQVSDEMLKAREA